MYSHVPNTAQIFKREVSAFLSNWDKLTFGKVSLETTDSYALFYFLFSSYFNIIEVVYTALFSMATKVCETQMFHTKFFKNATYFLLVTFLQLLPYFD